MLKGKKGVSRLRVQRSFLVCDAEDCVQVGVGVLGVGLGCEESVSMYRSCFPSSQRVIRVRTARGLGLLLGMCLCPLSLGLPDQRLLVAVRLLLGVDLLTRGYRQLRVGAVEETGGQGGPSEDLCHRR